MLRLSDRYDPENLWGAVSFSYFTEESPGISFGLIHALGDSITYEIKYTDILDNIKMGNGPWQLGN